MPHFLTFKEISKEGGKLYILQSRPITAVQNANVKNIF